MQNTSFFTWHCTSFSSVDVYLFVVVSKKEHKTIYNTELKYKKKFLNFVIF